MTGVVGTVRDASQLHGVIAHLASMHVEIISIVSLPRFPDCVTEARQSL